MSVTNLTGMTLEELEVFAESVGEKKYRGRQLFGWIYEKKVRSFDEMSSIAKSFRQRLQEIAALGHLQLLQKKSSPVSSAIKYLFTLADGHHIESVYITEDDRRTLCISSQVGCALNCAFCATAKIGFKRNLTVGEIVDQVLYVEHDLGVKLTNIVFMGMGEPFHNYDQVIKAAHLMNHADGIAVGARHIVISTAGVVKNIFRFTDEQQRFKLAISLNSPHQEQRSSFMPVAKQWNLDELFKAVLYYANGAKQLVTFEYVLFAGLNDSQKHAHDLRKLLSKIPCKLNIIPYNTSVDGFNRPDAATVDQFVKWLLPLASGPVSVRWSKGDDIDAACGQLAGKVLAKEQTGGSE
jgi:23S rRNA (adenine2503-C2)-methyltransferase